VGEVQLHPVAVKLNFVNPALALRHLVDVASAGSMKPG
jgi:hypothetical protein